MESTGDHLVSQGVPQAIVSTRGAGPLIRGDIRTKEDNMPVVRGLLASGGLTALIAKN